MQVYLDNSSTTRQSKAVIETVMDTVNNCFGNPSSLHSLGVKAEKLLRASRKKTADALGASAADVFFTSGGTESDNAAIFGAAEKLRHVGKHIITSETEHPAVLECFKQLKSKGYSVTYIKSDKNGIVDLEMLKDSIADNTILVSIMHVNNETGAVQPVKEIYGLVKKSGTALFHCDAVQSYGKMPPGEFKDMADLISASSHKIHGPLGAGLLFLRKGLKLPPFLYGGGQENGFRSGTENLPAIAGFGSAAEEAAANAAENEKKVSFLRDRLLSGLRENLDDIVLNGPEQTAGKVRSVPYILNVSFEGARGEVILHMLEQDGIYVSTGSACSSHKRGYSHVLKSMGRTAKEAEGAVRFSFSPYNTAEEIDYALDKIIKAVKENRDTMAIAAKMGHR